MKDNIKYQVQGAATTLGWFLVSVCIGFIAFSYWPSEPVKSAHQLDYEEIIADTAIIKADLKFIDSTLRARKQAKSHNVLVEHMETCKHK